MPGGLWPAFHAVLLWLVNLQFQSLIVILVLLATEHDQNPLEDHTFQVLYNKTRDDAVQALYVAVSSGNATLPIWFDKDLQMTCGVQMVPSFLAASAVMTLLWIMVMVGELKLCVWFFIFILNAEKPKTRVDTYTAMGALEAMEALNGDEDEYGSWGLGVVSGNALVLVERYDEDITIIAFTPLLKVVVVTIVPLVRAIIAVMLMLAGVKFVFVQTNLANAVLKVMTLKFVTTVDNVIMKAMSTKLSNRFIKNGKIYSPGARTTCATGSPGCWLSKHWEQIGGMCWVLIALLLWAVLFWGLLGGEFWFRRACLEYHKSFPGTLGVKNEISIKGALESLLSR